MHKMRSGAAPSGDLTLPPRVGAKTSQKRVLRALALSGVWGTQHYVFLLSLRGGNLFSFCKRKKVPPAPPSKKESTLLSSFRIKCHFIFTLPCFISILAYISLQNVSFCLKLYRICKIKFTIFSRAKVFNGEVLLQIKGLFLQQQC